MSLLIFIQGKPEPGGSKRAFYSKKSGKTWVIDSNLNVANWKDLVRVAVLQAYKDPPMQGPLYAEFTFYLKRPKSHFKTGKTNWAELKNNAPVAPMSKPDLTKLIRGTEDALKDIVFIDDAQIVERRDKKEYADKCNEGASVFIRAL
jgi:Holliday junction resolvase RusA-like endonuclease